MEQMIPRNYHTAIYLRLSKEDGDVVPAAGKSESNSITNQKAYILDFLKSKPELTVCDVFADDGYSGVDFDRPQFQKMLEAIKKREIDCVIVKDLSRFGRNYIEAGKYIEKLFPLLGVRFIAINDHYDSLNTKEDSADHLMVPFKNLINDAYCRDISVKIRSHLEIKRKKGEFIGAFTVYGYKKSAEQRNKLVVDEYAAENVKNIFRMRLCGMSNQSIADKLNDCRILSPLEYKKQEGIPYTTAFQLYAETKWNAAAIGRILKNEVYAGVLIQGKESTPNYKIKKRVKKSEADWIRIENTHEPIISGSEFDTVQRLLKEDTRILAEKETVALYAGRVKCADCGSSMVRKTVPAGKKEADGIRKKYVYYVCSGNKKNKCFCSAHRINADMLEEAVLLTVREHISYILSLKKALEYLKDTPVNRKDIKSLKTRQVQLKEEIIKFKEMKSGLYTDMREGILTKEEFLRYGSNFEQKIRASEAAARKLESEIAMRLNQKGEKQLWVEDFLAYRNITVISRKIATHLISRINIYEDNRIEIKFQYEEYREHEEQSRALVNLLEIEPGAPLENLQACPRGGVNGKKIQK